MRFTNLKLENWRNFRTVDVALHRRVFLVGPNASGKSNLLDALRFLRDIADPQGGFQKAVELRRGVSQIRSLHARRYPNVAIEVAAEIEPGATWTYRLEFSQNNQRIPFVAKELVQHDGRPVLQRPEETDRDDPRRLTQTHLEQLNANKKFRPVADALAQVRYLHLVPQLVRDPERSAGRSKDPYGGDLLVQIHRSPRRTRESRLRRIQEALRVAVPQLKELHLEPDAAGTPHLRGLYEHWRPNAGWQTEEQLSDGTLRLLGLLWSFLDGNAPLLLEEPELSLHAAVVRYVPSMIARLTRKDGRQVLLSTHSAELLSDEGIAPEEVMMLRPTHEGTVVEPAAKNRTVRALLDGHVPMGEAVLPQTEPRTAGQLALFEA